MNKELLIELYSTDLDFVSKYHGKNGLTPEECANDTWELIKDADSYIYDFGYFTIDKNKDVVPYLTGFFIKPDHRNKETFDIFYKELCTKMPKYFISGDKKDNLKVINFLKKFGATELGTNNKGDMTYLLFKQENL